MDTKLEQKRCRSFGDALTLALAVCRMSVAELGEVSDIDPNLIYAYKNDRKQPYADRLCQIALALNVSLDWLMGLDQSPLPKPLFLEQLRARKQKSQSD